MQERGSHSVGARASIWTLALCCAWLAQPAGAQQAGAREQSAATQRQAHKTEQANRAAAVEDETSAAAQAARTAQSEAAQFEAQGRRNNDGAAPSYGPVLAPRGQQAQDPARKDPAEVHDETDSLTRQVPQPQTPTQPAGQSQRQKPNPNLRRPAWQPAAEPMAPRPLRPADDASGSVLVPVPVPAQAPARPPRPVGPSSSVINSCQGNSCLDTGGNRINGIGSGNAGVNSSGRLCTRTGVTVQCF